MAILKIETLGAEVLRRRADEVEVVANDPETARLIEDMFETMYDAHGIGLAAPQVGISRRLIVVHVNEEDEKPFALFNPVVVESSKSKEKGEEGCLSIPGLYGDVKRAAKVEVEAYDRQGRRVVYEMEGMPARVVQHEVDHLDGVLFIDKVDPATLHWMDPEASLSDAE